MLKHTSRLVGSLERDRTSRREALGIAGAGLAVLGAAPLLAGSREATDSMTIGPMYPVVRPLDEDADLTRINGVKTGAKGQVIELSGRVLGANGVPVSNAKLELWQCNAEGRYAHPFDQSGRPLDSGFQGFGIQETDADGRYRFRTIKPGAYPTPDGRMRAAHLHFDVKGRGSRLITQMFFPGDPLHAQDFLLPDGKPPMSLIATEAGPTGSAIAFTWDVVLTSG